MHLKESLHTPAQLNHCKDHMGSLFEWAVLCQDASNLSLGEGVRSVQAKTNAASASAMAWRRTRSDSRLTPPMSGWMIVLSLAGVWPAYREASTSLVLQ